MGGRQESAALQIAIPNLYSGTTARSTFNTLNTTNPSSSSSSYSSHLPPTSSLYYPSSQSLYPSSFSYPIPAPAPAPVPVPASHLCPSFDLYSTRPFQALYTHSTLGTHTLGQSEAWLRSDSFVKRPKLESTFSLPVYPQRPGEKECAHYMLTKTCRFGESCMFDHPIWVPDSGIGIPDWKEMTLASSPPESHPERPGEPDCPYFLKTQKCKFGLNCKFNHPKDKSCTSGKTDAGYLPERPSEPLCSFYVKTGKCKYGATCKFHHPKDIQIPSVGEEASNTEKIKSAGNGILPNYENEVHTFKSDPAPSCNLKGLPMRLGEVDCPFYMKTGSCKYAANCRYNHPDRNVINPPAASVDHAVLSSLIPNLPVGLFNQASSILHNFQPSLPQTMFGPGPVLYPQRPDQKECDYYMKAGACKYGESCKFHHPIDRSAHKSVELTLSGLPRRKDAANCPFYMKTGACKYGTTCKFDHPPPGEVIGLIASERKENSATSSEEVKVGESALNPRE